MPVIKQRENIVSLLTLYKKDRLLRASLQEVTYSSVKRLFNDVNALNKRMHKDMQALLKMPANESVLEALLHIINIEGWILMMMDEVWKADFQKSESFKVKCTEFMHCNSLEVLNGKGLLKTMKAIQRKFPKNSDKFEMLETYLFGLRQLHKPNNLTKNLRNKTVDTHEHLRSYRDATPIIFNKEYKLNGLGKLDKKILKENAVAFEKNNPCMLIDSFIYNESLMRLHDRNTREKVWREANQVPEEIQLKINDIFALYFKQAEKNGFASPMQEKLGGANLTVTELSKWLNAEIKRSSIDFKKMEKNIEPFVIKDGLSLKDLKVWDYQYYAAKYDTAICEKAKNDGISFDRELVIEFLQKLLNDLFDIELVVKKRKRDGNVTYAMTLNHKGDSMQLYVVGSGIVSYFRGAAADFQEYCKNDRAGMIAIPMDKELTYNELKIWVHEFGHAIAFFFYKCKMEYKVDKESWEFMEVESLLMENILKETNVLEFFVAKGELLTKEVLKKYTQPTAMETLLYHKDLEAQKIWLELSDRKNPFTYGELLERFEKTSFVELWLSDDNKFLDEVYSSYLWSDWIYPYNNYLSKEILNKYIVGKSADEIKQNCLLIYSNLLTRDGNGYGVDKKLSKCGIL